MTEQPGGVRVEELLRCVPFSDSEVERAIRQHERSSCAGACLSAAAGREILRLRRAAYAAADRRTEDE